ncbi:MAG: response regulator [Candidatus Pristimantibacillus lignocellulolyticus]|uniref:Response regulator n=1 Tax=Candidatus Pristimantibacillus lignocellulolyticus TaxID=2994561 RepID=A0A9J6ZB33_9BACL|nr:MAG: response regulator [Candidatus Pristimantibacillus lignocellulolyticus]
MYKVMIVDDEPMIRQGLQSLIEWNEYGFQVVALASNGVEAIELYKEHFPDLILIDIRMPIMDGIRAIGELRQLGANSRILVLSGYGEFQYAQQAIRYKVDGYVMKPIDEHELIMYIEKASKELNQLQQAPIVSSQTIALLREEWLKDFVEHELEEAELSIDHWKRLFTHPFLQANIVLVDTYSREISTTTRNTIKQQLSIFIEDQTWGYVFSTDTYIGIIISQSTMNQAKKEHLNNIIELSCNHKAQFVAVMTSTHTDLVALYEEVIQLKSALKNRFFMNSNKLFNLTDIIHAHDDDKPKLPLMVFIDQMSQKIFYVMDLGNKTRLDELIEQIADLLRNYCDTEQQMKSSWAQLLTMAIKRISAMHPQLLLEADLKLVTQLYLTHHYQLMLEQLKLQLTSLMNCLTVTASTNTTVIKQMIDFIDRHYAEPLRLETMADLFNYNSGYLGKMFKNHTGVSFNTYLDNVRIEQSIVMLQEGYKVHQVAERVGYANVDYFHSKFKKYKGVSPSAYKPNPLSISSTDQ